MLLVFRTNASYDRFYEGRKLWSTLKTHTRNLGRYFMVFIPDTLEERSNRILLLNLLIAYCYTIKQKLRGFQLFRNDKVLRELLPEDIISLKLTREEYVGVLPSDNGATYPNDLSTFILLRLNEVISSYLKRGIIDAQCNTMILTLLNTLSNTFGDMERISNTPLPLAYRLHLNHCQWLYLLFLPITLVSTTGIWAVVIEAVIAFTFFGISAIGDEIENPFGLDKNDLPLDSIILEIRTELSGYAKKKLPEFKVKK